MEAFAVSLILLAAVVLSSVLTRILRLRLPLPLMQIILGAVIAAIFDFRIELDPPTFLLFLAPLLFLDGWRISKEALFAEKITVSALAFGLVFFTVAGVGFFLHWMIPAMPLAVAFALAAAISPTDAVAVSAIVSRMPVPKRLIHILEGESLLNDASGLVCMRFAIAAAMTGRFSVAEAVGTFLWIAIGGVFVGLVVSLIATTGKDWISRRFGEETGSQILVSLLIPFGAYMLAERAGASGILAAVAAGVVMSYEERSGRALAATRINRAAVWDALQFAGNGVIFVLLGEQLPNIASGAFVTAGETDHAAQLLPIVYVFAVSVVLIVLRFLWAGGTLALMIVRRMGTAQRSRTPAWRLITAASFAGARGAVTLAGVLALPLVLPDGSPFPARNLAIFIAAGVIVVSLIVANVGLPYVIRGLELLPDSSLRRAEDETRNAIARAAIIAVEQNLRDNSSDQQSLNLRLEAGTRVLEIYRQRLDSYSEPQEGHLFHKMDELERELRLVAIEAERAELHRIARTDHLPEEFSRRLVREFDLLEARFRLT